MNAEEAKAVLQAWRTDGPGQPGDGVREALALLESDPKLQEWWAREQAFDLRMSEAVDAAAVPPGLRERILADPPAAEGGSNRLLRFPPVFSIAASLAALLLVGILLLDPLTAEAEPDFSDFLDHVSSDGLAEAPLQSVAGSAEAMELLRADLQAAPSDLPARVSGYRTTAAGSGNWRGLIVGLIRLEDDTGRTARLYVVLSTSFPPSEIFPNRPETRVIENATLIVWEEKPFVYALAETSKF